MAVVLIEGFDHLSAAQMTAKDWTINCPVTTGRFSGQAVSPNGGQVASKPLPASLTELTVGYATNHSALITAQPRLTLKSGGAGGTNVVRLYTFLSGGLYYYQLVNSAGTVLGTGTTALTAEIWYYVEVYVLVHASAGEVELRLNGLPTAEITATGLNTGSSSIDTVHFAGAGGGSHLVDDLYVNDTTGSSPNDGFLGDCRVETLAPDGNGTNTAWTGTYTDWDDSTAHDTDTTYISSSTPNDKETSTLGAVTSAGASVYAVQTNLIARKDDTGTRTIAPVLRVGGTDYDGTTTAGLSASYLDYSQLYDRLDPSGATWTGTTLNAMEAGIKVIA